MFSKPKARLIVFAAVAATLGGGLFVYVTPTSTSAAPVPLADRPGIASDAATNWGELSADAVDAGGIETDLDGNAASLYASDQWCGLPACGSPAEFLRNHENR